MLARTLVVARTHAGPGGEVPGGREASHVSADLAHDEAVAQEVGDPFGIAHVGLAAGDRLDVSRVGDHEREVALEHVVDGLREGAGALHRDVGNALLSEPIAEGQQLFGQCAKRA
jgi:hypothetical protein